MYLEIHSDIYIRVVQSGPVHPVAQEHIPGDTHVPPLKQSCGHRATTIATTLTLLLSN